MAEAADKGGGSDGSPWAFFGVLGAVGAAQAAVGEVVTELESFTKFQQRVDELIKDLKESPAGPRKVGQEALARAKFGGGPKGWHEADGVSSQYDTVITDLENLSKLLSDSIEAMGIAVLASHKGYNNVDMDVRRRMAAISAEATHHWGGEYNPEKEKQESEGKSKGAAHADGSDKPEKDTNKGYKAGNA
ncbi:hypothetical protein OG698_28280 [Streptomyces sp. NBC_01003]|uniref:hypothetical protein n=1 Tax=Streptomyces sp. NBC_01003 TaxID=2903714 RepID=UPI00386D8FED|nr:hypothetical protein OG698_28280 [Streptomyces sp. NBC_01003]